MVDGFNLALEKGTGVATYARNLTYIFRDLELQTNVLYGRPIGRARSSLLTEVQFFDPLLPSSGLDQTIAFLDGVAPAIGGVSAYQVPVKGNVILRSQSARLPYFDRIMNAKNLYRRAETTLGSGIHSLRLEIRVKSLLRIGLTLCQSG